VTVVVDGRCTACGVCVVTCPERALRPAPARPAVIDERCTGCLACVEVCPAGAITEEVPWSIP
jgi:Pyruvate/2-oxoacid:ferredoxin oxidoreductase delta subunit